MSFLVLCLLGAAGYKQAPLRSDTDESLGGKRAQAHCVQQRQLSRAVAGTLAVVHTKIRALAARAGVCPESAGPCVPARAVQAEERIAAFDDVG